jgi:Flp pilus assembly CpaF family ATPase
MTVTKGEVASVARQLATGLSATEALDRAVDEVSQRRALDLSARQELQNTARQAMLGYGVLQPYFDDESVEEIWINRPNEVFELPEGAWSVSIPNSCGAFENVRVLATVREVTEHAQGSC